MFPVIFMHSEQYPEIVDIKDKGWAGKVHYLTNDRKLKIIGQMSHPSTQMFLAKEEYTNECKRYNLMVLKLDL